MHNQFEKQDWIKMILFKAKEAQVIILLLSDVERQMHDQLMAV